MMMRVSTISLILLLFWITPAFSAPRGPVLLDRLEAYVNSSPILLSDVQKYRHLLKLRSQIDPLFASSSIAQKGEQANNAEIIDALISDKLIEKEYPKTDSEVEQDISGIEKTNRLDRETLKETLAHEGYTFEDYFELTRDSSSKRDLIEREIRNRISVSDDDIKNYYYNHIYKSTGVPRSFHIKLITIAASSYKNSAVALKIAKQALEQIKGGESFEEVARRVSDDSGTKDAGGDLGHFTEDQMSDAIRNEIKKLQIGQVSEVFGTTQNYYILKLVDVRSAENERLEKMKEEIRSQLLAKEYEHQIKLWQERKKQSAFIHIANQPTVQPLAPSKH
jgi:peptidyl-prolyl cis-trans isomerase SurA